jgi:hypothetical protein
LPAKPSRLDSWSVDAVDESAVRFYRRRGFTETLDHPFRLYRRMKDVRASLTSTDA